MTLRLAKRLYRAAVTLDLEERAVLGFVNRSCAGQPGRARILDVGCGKGRYLRLLRAVGYSPTGVEVNPDIVRANRNAGFDCFTPKQLTADAGSFDAVLMSHVIEHLSPADLVRFMDEYLDRLRPGGYLIIATPLLSKFFYDDFDHVKPYHPFGLLMVFGDGQAQVQYYARNRLELEDVWIRRSPLCLGHGRSRYVPSWRTRARQAADFTCALLYRATGGIIGTADGWVGLFRKLPTKAPT